MKKSMLTMALLVLSAFVFAGGQRGGSGEPRQVTSIRWLGVQHAWTNTITQYLPEFEAATGIKVQFESYTEEQLSNKLAVESTAKSKTMDVYNFRPLQESLVFAKNGWAEPLNDFYKNDVEYDIADFSPAALGSVTVDGKVLAIPLIVEAEVLYYNKKLLAEKGVAVPTTQAELYEAAAKLTDKNRGIYGIVIRGARSAAVTQFSGYLFSNGGDFMTNGKAGLTSPAAIKSFKLYGDLLRNFGPPGVLNMSWPQAAELFSQGKVAMYTDASSLYNSAVGEIAADIGTALFPAGDISSRPYNVCTWSLGIGINSEKKDAAWTLIKWLTSKEMMGRTQALGNSMARTSAWENPENNKSFPADFIDVVRRSGAIGSPYDRPVLARVQEARDVIGTVIVASINGEDVEAAARDAQTKFQDIIDHDSQ
jgi:multiple sugar transport system substrate-binding protein